MPAHRGTLVEQAHRLSDLVAVVDQRPLRQGGAGKRCSACPSSAVAAASSSRPSTASRAPSSATCSLAIARTRGSSSVAYASSSSGAIPSSLARPKRSTSAPTNLRGVSERPVLVEAQFEDVVAQEHDRLRTPDDARVISTPDDMPRAHAASSRRRRGRCGSPCPPGRRAQADPHAPASRPRPVP